MRESVFPLRGRVSENSNFPPENRHLICSKQIPLGWLLGPGWWFFLHFIHHSHTQVDNENRPDPTWASFLSCFWMSSATDFPSSWPDVCVRSDSWRKTFFFWSQIIKMFSMLLEEGVFSPFSSSCCFYFFFVIRLLSLEKLTHVQFLFPHKHRRRRLRRQRRQLFLPQVSLICLLWNTREEDIIPSRKSLPFIDEGSPTRMMVSFAFVRLSVSVSVQSVGKDRKINPVRWKRKAGKWSLLVGHEWQWNLIIPGFSAFASKSGNVWAELQCW